MAKITGNKGDIMKKYKIYAIIAIIGSILYKVWKNGVNYAFNKQRKKNDKIKRKVRKGVSNLSTRGRNKLRKRYNRR
jgi:hypothetical protein